MKECCSNSTPRVSLIIPVYNAGKRFELCLDSVLRQDFADFELILVDDGSTDGSGDVCDKAADSDNRVRGFHKENGGVSTARNEGIAMAKGRWICFVDADDTVDDNYLSSLLSVDPQEGDLVITGIRHSYSDGTPDKENYSFEKTETTSDPSKLIGKYKLLNIGFPPCKLFDRGLILSAGLSFDPELTFHEDHVFCLEYFLRCKRVCLVEGMPYSYWHGNSASLSSREHPSSELRKAAEKISFLMKAIRKKYPRTNRYWFSLQYADYGLHGFVEAYKAATTVQDRKAAAKEIRKRWFDYIRYYHDCRTKSDRRLVGRILCRMA